jgi:transcriptional regulator with XRE-family HTH domain
MPRYGELVRNAREARGLSLEQVAEGAGMDPAALRGIEDGTRPAPLEDLAKRIADALHLHGDDAEMLSVAAMLESPIMGAFRRPRAADEPQQASLTAAILVFLIADVRGYTRFTQA